MACSLYDMEDDELIGGFLHGAGNELEVNCEKVKLDLPWNSLYLGMVLRCQASQAVTKHSGSRNEQALLNSIQSAGGLIVVKNSIIEQNED